MFYPFIPGYFLLQTFLRISIISGRTGVEERLRVYSNTIDLDDEMEMWHGNISIAGRTHPADSLAH